MKKKIAVVLCGSGYLDGSEIRESVGALWALSKHAVDVQCFAPNAEQADVMNCLTKEPVANEARNQLVEGARIARGNIKPLGTLEPRDYDALILPGGFGAAKNLCDFAKAGANGVVRTELQRILVAMHAAKKPLGAICIAPAILALAFKGKGIEMTVGAAGEAAGEIEKLGQRHITCRADECHVDKTHRVVTTPAYMYDDALLHEIFTGIDKLVNEVIRLA